MGRGVVFVDVVGGFDRDVLRVGSVEGKSARTEGGRRKTITFEALLVLVVLLLDGSGIAVPDEVEADMVRV